MVSQSMKESIAIFTAGLLMGTVGLYVRGLPNAMVSSFMRGLFAAFFILLYLIVRKKIDVVKKLKLMFRHHLVQGVFSMFTVVFYFLGIIYAGYAIAAFLLYTGGIFSLIFSRIFLKEHISKKNAVALLMVLGGVFIIMEPWNIELSEITLGFIYSLLSGLCLGSSIFTRKIIFSRMKEQYPEVEIGSDFVTGMVLFPAIILIIVFTPIALGDIIQLEWHHWLYGIGLGFLPTAVAFSLYNYGVQNDKSGDKIILSYVEPIVASIINVILLEIPALSVLVGGACILIANTLIRIEIKKD